LHICNQAANRQAGLTDGDWQAASRLCAIQLSHSKPVIRDTRIPVTVVLGSLAGGMSFEEVLREYDVTADDIRAALRFVAELTEQESFHSLPSA
jgi:uncharacterized protein (DUF433 family)